MMNTSVKVNPPNVENTVKIDAVTGTLTRSNSNSFFVNAMIGSDVAKKLDGRTPTYGTKDKYTEFGSTKKEQLKVVILQAMNIGGGYILYELMDEDDYRYMVGKR